MLVLVVVLVVVLVEVVVVLLVVVVVVVIGINLGAIRNKYILIARTVKESIASKIPVKIDQAFEFISLWRSGKSLVSEVLQ